MSRFGITVFGTDYFGEAVDSMFDASPFVASATSYTDVFVLWRKPSGSWSKQRLVRNSNGMPVTADDGVTLLEQAYDDALSQYADTGLTSGRFYYYALFLYDPALELWRMAGSDETLVPFDFGYTNRLYQRVPEVFRAASFDQVGSNPVDEDSFLYKFLAVVGNELDFLRTEYEAVKELDARTINLGLLPSLGKQVGMEFEQQLGSRAQRRLVQNAIHLYKTKGTLPGIGDLATIVTGWDSGVRIGRNIALDDLDAGPKGSEGRWTGFDGSASVVYRARRGGSYPIPDVGYLDITAAGLRADCIIHTNRATVADGYEAMQYAVPIVQGRSYTVSQYVSGPTTDYHARMRIDWLDTKGRSLGYFTEGSDQPLSDIFTARPFVTAIAPTGARYLAAQLVIEADTDLIAADTSFRAVGFMVDESTELRAWECAREIIIQLRAEQTNENIYPRPAPDAVTSTWHSNAGSDTTIDGWFASTTTSLHDPVDVFPGAVDSVFIDHKPGTGYSLSAEVQIGTVYDVRFIIQTLDVNDVAGVAVTDAVEVDVTGTVTAQISPELFGDDIKKLCFGIRFDTAIDVGGEVLYRNIGVYRSNGAVDYFDGSTASPTGDNLWEGEQYESRSHHYTQRVVRAQRLRELLKDFLPNGSCYALEFAQPTVPLFTMPWAIAGLDVNPGDPPPPPPVGRSLEMQWNLEESNAKSLELRWNVGVNTVSKDLGIVFHTMEKVAVDLQVMYDVDDLSGTVGANLDLVWNQLQVLSFGEAPATDESAAGWTNATFSTNQWSLTNVSETNYIYPGSGPLYQTGTYEEYGTDGVLRTGTFAIPNVGDTLYETVQAPGGTRTSVRDVVFYGAFGEVIYHWYNRSADFTEPRIVGLRWHVLGSPNKDLSLIWDTKILVHQDHSEVWNVNDTGYSGGYSGGY